MINVSVIISAYQAELYLLRCVESVLSQKNIEIEIIIINNGSSDLTCQIGKTLLEQYSNIILINLPRNISLSDAYTIGFFNAVGEYIIFLDSDDQLVDNALQILYNKAKKNNSDIVLYHAYHIKDNKLIEAKQFILDFENDIISDPLRAYFSRKIHTTIWSKFIRREYLYEKNIIFPSHILWCVDTAMNASLLMYSPIISTCNEFLYKYYIHSKNSSSSKTTSISEFKRAIEFVIKELIKNDLLERYKDILQCFIWDIIDWGKQAVGDNEELKKQLDKYYIECILNLYGKSGVLTQN